MTPVECSDIPRCLAENCCVCGPEQHTQCRCPAGCVATGEGGGLNGKILLTVRGGGQWAELLCDAGLPPG